MDIRRTKGNSLLRCTEMGTLVQDSRIDDFLVSTIFLGANQRLGEGVPILFETMVFCNDKPLDKYSRRCLTWNEAVEGHQAVITLVEADSK